MWVKSLRGEHPVEFGPNREIKYKFRAVNPGDDKSPVMCEIKDPEHLARLLVHPTVYEPYAETDEERAEADAFLAGLVRTGVVSGADGGVAAIPLPHISLAHLADEGTSLIDVRVSIPRPMYKAIENGTHELDVFQREGTANDGRVVPPGTEETVVQVSDGVRDLLDGGSRVELLAYAAQHKLKHNRNKTPDDELRTAIRDHALLLKDKAAA